jgi:hypothetical protein
MLMSADPKLDASAAKALLMDTSRRHPRLMVNRPGTQAPVRFSDLSTSGAIVDAVEALKPLK